VGPTAGLEGCGQSRSPPEIDPPNGTGLGESLYRLSYPGPLHSYVLKNETVPPCRGALSGTQSDVMQNM
jgi:hypothetical protein